MKIVVFVPDQDLASVSDAMFLAGAGHIGQYYDCSFRLSGTGTFFGSEATNPAIGQKGRREEVAEWRLEMVCPEKKLDAVLAAMRRSHSYEEPAHDVYPLHPRRSPLGDGRIASNAPPSSLENFAKLVKERLPAPALQLVGAPDRVVRKVAIVCGAGGELLMDAIRERADVFLTGELRFHDYLSARAQGLALVLPGHFATERPGVEELAVQLQQQWPEVRVWASREERDPVAWI